MDKALWQVLPVAIGVSIVSLLIAMLEQITIPEDDLPLVVQQLKRIHSREPTKAVGGEVKESMQRLIEHLSSLLPT